MGGLLFIFSAVVTILWVAAWQGLIRIRCEPPLVLVVCNSWDVMIVLNLYHQNEGLNHVPGYVKLAAMVFTVIYQHEGFKWALNNSNCWLYGLFIIFWIVGFSNAGNLTDNLMAW